MTFAAVNNTVHRKRTILIRTPITSAAPLTILLKKQNIQCHTGLVCRRRLSSRLTDGDVRPADAQQGAREPVVVRLLAVPQQPVCQGRPALSLAI